MKWLVSSACVFSVLLFTVYAAPASTGLQVSAGSAGSAGGQGGISNIISNIDLPGLLQGLNSVVKLIGVVCPPLSQVLDNVIQNVTSTAFRVFGRIILRSGGLGGGNAGGSSAGGGEQTVNVVLPTFPPDEEDYDDENDDNAEASNNGSKTSTTQKIAVTENASPVADNDESSNAIAKRHTRVIREAAEAEENNENAEEDTDQDGAESAPEPDQHLADADDQDRNKRFLPFGGGDAQGHGGAGSGNFLFDIIRNTADRAARAVGTVYRMVAGTDNEGGAWSFAVSSIPKATKTLSTASSSLSASVLPSKLVAGSGASEESDEHDGGAAGPGGIAEIDVQKTADGYTEGIPGPITRLFVLANRGIANLIQDLILRLAQTSERLVNFKARLITSLI